MVEVLGEDGKPAIGDVNGNPQTIPGLLKELREIPEIAHAFPPDDTSGSGRTGGDGQVPRVTTAGGKKVISRRDQRAMNQNVEGIADGSVTVVD
jgi:hypothetical protein